MQTNTFSRAGFIGAVAQRLHAVFGVFAIAAMVTTQLLTSVSGNGANGMIGSTRAAFVVHDATLTPPTDRCPSVGC